MRIRLLALLTCGIISWAAGSASGQTVDASFQPTTLYTPAFVTTAVSQPDGKRVVLGGFANPQTKTTARLVRYNTDNSVDQAFAANVATLRGSITNVRALASGKLLLIGDGPLTLGSLTRQDLLLLNADGTADASFDAGTASGTGLAYVSAVQPDGKILLGGTFTSYNGTAAQRIVRLLPSGAVDASFNAGTQLNNTVKDITLQADGKILIGGSFDSPAAIARLLPNGALDTSFTSPLSTQADIIMINVQPDGNVLLAGEFRVVFSNGSSQLVRLLPNGIPDPAFAVTSFSSTRTNAYDTNEFVVQPDGRVIIAMQGYYDGNYAASLMRINANGTYDTSFTSPLANLGHLGVISSLQPQPNGQILVAGYGSFRLPGRRGDVLLLNADGTVDQSFNPTLLMRGSVNSMAQQADGKLIIGGDFDEANGVRTKSLARFNVDGSLDAAFSGQVAIGFMANKVAVQPDGNILVSGNDPTSGSMSIQYIVRLQPSGAVDNTFQTVPDSRIPFFALQPDGRIIITENGYVKRLLNTGQPDNSLTTASALGIIYALAVQPDGKILVGGSFGEFNNRPLRALVRLEPNGTLDAGFSTPIQSVVDYAEVEELLIQPDGKVVVGGLVSDNYPSTMPYGLFRILPNGSLDNTFTASLPTVNGFGFVRGLTLQPNGRILVGVNSSELLRILPSGQVDTSFGNAIFNSDVEETLIQPDGKIVAGGYFTSVNGQPSGGLTRLTAPNVLHVASAQREARTQAWPVPAHEMLNLSLDAAAQPQSVQLLDNLGRTVLTQSVTQDELTVPLRQVQAGIYLLRVNYASGPVTRRVVIE